MSARWVNMTLGIWLVLSAFLWPHGMTQFWNAVSMGFLVAAFALLASETAPSARYLNTALGAWLVISSFLMSSSMATLWNHLIVGIAVLLLSLFPDLPAFTRSRSRVPHGR